MRTLTPDQQRVKDLVEVFDTPIVFHPGGWEDTLPEWLKLRVIKERVDMVCNGGWNKATDAEVTCYLYTASLVQPLGSDWTEITLYQAAKQIPQLREALPATPKELSDYQKHELESLKRNIRDSQIRRRKSKRKEKDMPKRKLVLEEHDGSVLVGVIQEGCDPVIKTESGNLEDVLPAVPGFLKEAEEKRAAQPKNPTYKPPAAPKPTPAPAAQAPKAEELPLLSGTEAAQPKAEEQAPKPEEQAAAPTEEQAEVPTEAPTEAPAEEKAEEAAAEVTEPPAAPAEIEPEPTVPAEPEAIEPIEAGVAEDKVEAELSERIAQVPAPSAAQPEPSQPAKPGEWEYYLQDGRGPYETVQLAMDALGLDANTRPQHNRWDRLSTALKEKIQRRPKA